jgi:hypothetical protein
MASPKMSRKKSVTRRSYFNEPLNPQEILREARSPLDFSPLASWMEGKRLNGKGSATVKIGLTCPLKSLPVEAGVLS